MTVRPSARDGVLVTADWLGAVIEAAGFRDVGIVALGDEAARTFALIHRSVRQQLPAHRRM